LLALRASPNLDSIAEFPIRTSNTDAEYGNYSGGLINVVTKSGGKYNLNNPYPSGFAGATVPNPTGGSFDATSNGLDQLSVVSKTKTFGSVFS
jgi:hypothetical protein